MKIYRMVKIFYVGAGTLVALSKEQVSPRRHRLEDVGEGLYRTKELMQFKAGERVGFVEFVVPKVHEDRVELIEAAGDEPVEPSAPSPTAGWSGKRKGPR